MSTDYTIFALGFFHKDERGTRLEQQIGVGLGPSPHKVVDVSPFVEFLHSLGLSRYEEAFIHEEIDWDTLQWLTEEVCFVAKHITITTSGWLF